MIGWRHQDAGWLDVAMHDAEGMRCLQGPRDLIDDSNRSPRHQRSLRANELAEADAIDPPGGDEEPAVALPRLIHGSHVWVIDRGKCRQLSVQAGPCQGVSGQI